MKKKFNGKKWIALLVLLLLAVAVVYYYVTLPAFNIHSVGFWTFILSLWALLIVFFALRKKIKDGDSFEEIKDSKLVKGGVFVFITLVVIFFVGAILSSPIVNAKQYRELITVEKREFTEDIKEVDYNQIPILDKASATLLGNRKMGSMVDMVSQFEVSNLYSQINYKGKPVRVTPLVYASPIKWLTNQSDGIPAYIMIDMTTEKTELVKLEDSIKYSQSEYFNRRIDRHLRFKYPTYIFDKLSFEIDDEGTPYWICPVKKFTIGLFGGETIGRVVICNAITGETQDYAIEDCPQWVDQAFPASMLIQQYDYYGELINGFLNSVLGQKGCLQTTDGYNYIAMDDDVWVYTGITSVSGDESNVGFVLMNQRTHKVHYYEINGAEEYSAMDSAQGQVQNLGYEATFPLLINVANEPTYIMALKDGAGLVKKYAMVNIQQYQNVAIGDTVAQCEKAYINMLEENGLAEEVIVETEEVTGTITKIAQSVIGGNSHFYLILDGREEIFDVPFAEFVEIIKYNVGDSITLEYASGSTTATVTSIE